MCNGEYYTYGVYVQLNMYLHCWFKKYIDICIIITSRISTCNNYIYWRPKIQSNNYIQPTRKVLVALSFILFITYSLIVRRSMRWRAIRCIEQSFIRLSRSGGRFSNFNLPSYSKKFEWSTRQTEKFAGTPHGRKWRTLNIGCA